MALPVSPNTISLNQVNTELGLTATATISLNDAAVRTLAGVSSGQISMSDLHGKSNSISATGGTVTTSGGYKIHTFTSSGTFSVSSVPSGATIRYLVVAGGGGGGNNNSAGSAGGGGGASGADLTSGLGDAFCFGDGTGPDPAGPKNKQAK
jgi:hypothetical protein